MSEPASGLLEALLTEAIRAVHAGDATRRALAARPMVSEPRVRLLAIGKAAAAMAQAAADVAGASLIGGLVITKDGHTGPAIPGLSTRESGHPVPDERSEAAAREALSMVTASPHDDVWWVLLSGGASALTACPAPGLCLDDLARATRVLLGCGADIEAMNTFRKHLSSFAGGRLARAAGGRGMLVLAVSDVAGDLLDVIGSGPCAADPSSFADALALLDRFAIRDAMPPAVIEHLERGQRGEVPESPKPGDPCFARVESHIIARNADAIEAIVEAARARGIDAVDLGQRLEGEAREAGRALAVLACSRPRTEKPQLLVAGGETVVTLRGEGRGGRNQELALAAALELARIGSQAEGIELLAAGTDGSDGPTSAAGAHVDHRTVARAGRRGFDAAEFLANNDSHSFFAGTEGLVMTGPTGTNVMDLVMVYVPAR